MRDGVPFSVDIPDKLTTRDTLTKEKFNIIMQEGLTQAKEEDTVSIDEAFAQLQMEI